MPRPSSAYIYLAKLRITVVELLINLLTFALSTRCTKEKIEYPKVFLEKPNSPELLCARRYRRSRKPLNFESGLACPPRFVRYYLSASGLVVTTSRPSCARHSRARRSNEGDSRDGSRWYFRSAWKSLSRLRRSAFVEIRA